MNVCNTVILLALINIMLIGSTSPSFYHKSILSNFNFCPLAWHFCMEKNSKKIEKVQERALRFVYEDYNTI
jgi:hypothetical protein